MRYQYFVDFWHGISVFANFSYGIAVLGTPQCPPSMALLSNFVTFFRSADPDSSPVVSKSFLLIKYLLGKRLGYARGEDQKVGRWEASFSSSPSLKSPF